MAFWIFIFIRIHFICSLYVSYYDNFKFRYYKKRYFLKEDDQSVTINWINRSLQFMWAKFSLTKSILIPQPAIGNDKNIPKNDENSFICVDKKYFQKYSGFEFF